MHVDQIEELMDADIVNETVIDYRTMRALEGIRFQLARIADHFGGQFHE
jgi:hypothetical protein